MNGKDLQLEEVYISEAVGLALHDADLGIGAFKRCSRNRIVVVGEEPRPMRGKSPGELLEHPGPGGVSTRNPIIKKGSGLGFLELLPEAAQFFLQVVGLRQRSIDLQGSLKAVVL